LQIIIIIIRKNKGHLLNRAKWFNVHSWVGVQLSILLCFVLITGTLATVSQEIDWATNKAMRVAPQSVTNMNWQAIYVSARERSKTQHFSGIRQPTEDWFAAQVIAFDADKQRYRMFFHPTTGEYLGEGRWYNWQRFFRMSHRHLMLPVKYGVPIISICAFLLLTSLVTSFVVYRHWWKGFLRWPRKQHRKLFWSDMHRLLGAWNIWFILVVSITGIWYLLEVLGVRASYPDRGQVVSQQAKDNRVMPSPEIFLKAMKKVDIEFPDLDIKTVRFPSRKNSPMIVQGQSSAILVRDRANLISFDPMTGEFLSKFRGEQLNAVARITEAVDPLHFGTFAGLPSRILYFIFGILLSTLAVSGTYMFAMKTSRISHGQVFSKRKVWKSAFSKMGFGKWFSYVSIAICLLIAVGLFTGLITQ
jgi:uncharacterized iron-regulated membrane protein